MTSADRDRLLQLIEDTFGAIPSPKCAKRIARALDDEWFPSKERCEELQALDLEEDWRQVTPEDLYKYSNVLFWLSPDGFRFYIPAFLRYAIESWDRQHD